METLIRAVALLALTGPASAARQQQCAMHTELMAALAKGNEKPVSSGSDLQEKVVVELTLSPEGAWSLVGTFPSGLSCILYGGKNWDHGRAPVPGRDS